MSSRRAIQKKRSKSKHPNWLNYSAFVLGVAVSLCASYLVLSVIFDIGDIEADESTVMAADSQAANNSEESLEDSFEYLLAIADVNELKAMLAKLSNVDPDQGLPMYFEKQRRRIRITQQLLMSNIDEETRLLAVRSKLGAHSNLFNATLKLGETPPEIVEEMRFASEKYASDSNIQIQKLAKTALFGLDLFENAKSDQAIPKVEKIVDQIVTLIREFPESEDLLFNLRSMLRSLEQVNPEMALRISQRQLERIEEFRKYSAENFAVDYSDWMKLKGFDFQEKLAKLPTASGELRDELLKISLELAKDPGIGMGVLKDLNVFGNWLENQKDTDSAKQIYQSLLDSVEFRTEEDAIELVTELGTKGLARCEALGQKFIVSGESVHSPSLFGQNLANQNLLIIFWQQNIELQSSRLERNLTEISKLPLDSNQIKVLLVEISPEEITKENPLIDQFPAITFINWEQGSEKLTALLEYFPINIIPRAIIVDKEGYLVKSNIQLQQIIPELRSFIVELGNRD